MSVLKKPLLTEKMTKITDKKGQYGFIVKKDADKITIKAEIEKLYGVEVIRINTALIMGKRKTKFTKNGLVTSKKPNFKKAIVKLKEGQSIDFFENI